MHPADLDGALQPQLSALLLNADAEEIKEVKDFYRPDPANAYEPFQIGEMPGAYVLGSDPSFELHVMHHFWKETSFKSLDLSRYRQAWASLFERHEVLKTEYVSEGKVRINPKLQPRIDVVDLSKASGAQIATELAAQREQWAHFSWINAGAPQIGRASCRERV